MESYYLFAAQSRADGWNRSISVFLHSLAEAVGDKAVAITLSGMDADGSAALQAIKDAGGIVFVQSKPAVEDMPVHAMSTGHVDFVLKPSEIAAQLLPLDRADPLPG